MTDPNPLPIDPLDRPPDATIALPGSKSLTNRALLLGALAEGPSTVHNALDADDSRAMVDALRALGADVTADWDDHVLRIEPAPRGSEPDRPRTHIDARLSGTTARFVLPVACLSGRATIVDGLEPLRRRPLGPLIDALRAVGASITELGMPGCLPVSVSAVPPAGGTVEVDGAMSSQYLSALLLSAARFPQGLDIAVTGRLVAEPFVDLTIDALSAFGVRVDQPAPGRYVVGPQPIRGAEFLVEPDATAASYFAAAAAMTGGRIRLAGLTATSAQGDVGFMDVLELMGATVTRADDAIVVTGGTLHGIDVDLSAIPDTAQTLAVVAVGAVGPTRVRGVGFIRGHETDRVAAVVNELQRLGIAAAETTDGFTITPGTPHPAVVQTYGDHRMAMSFALLGLRNPGIRIADPEVVAKTYPRYFDDLGLLRSRVGHTGQ